MKIKLNDKTGIDLTTLVASRLLIQANSGGGKSYSIRRIIEQAFGHVQIIVIDPEGEFGNMRSKFDFVYAGKDGDAPAESRSAALLAHRLLELKASAIIDLYELPPQERKHFVRLFLESMVNAPKDLWHDCLVILDEAHVFAPEKDQSESLGAVIDMASRGRKRGYCLIPATQRPAKLNKDVAAECNNKLIGRASLDIDRKRAAEELGFTTKEQVLSLRDLEPGEFYAFGPAISREVLRVPIGDVQVKPPKRGVLRGRVPAASAKVKQILSKLADLPQEAAQEAKTVAELKKALSAAQGQIRAYERAPKAADPDAIRKAVEAESGRKTRQFSAFKLEIYNILLKTHGNIGKALELLMEQKGTLHAGNIEKVVRKIRDQVPQSAVPTPDGMPLQLARHHPDSMIVRQGRGDMEMGSGERQVLIAIAGISTGMTREHITVQTGYKRSTRDAYIQRLGQKGYIESNRDGYSSSKIFATTQGIAALGDDYQELPTGQALIDHHLRKLPDGERKIFNCLIQTDGHTLTRDELSEQTGYKRSTRDAYIQRLSSRQLVQVIGGSVAASAYLFE